jgi:thioredoxin-related protein
MTKLYLSNVKPYKEKEVKLSDDKSVVVGFRLYKEEELKEFNEVIASEAIAVNILKEKLIAFEAEGKSEDELKEFMEDAEKLTLLDKELTAKFIVKAKESIIFFKNVTLTSINDETFEEVDSTIADTRKGEDKEYFDYIRSNIFATKEEELALLEAFNEIRNIDFKAEQLKNL